jgi:hypothetical protein
MFSWTPKFKVAENSLYQIKGVSMPFLRVCYPSDNSSILWRRIVQIKNVIWICKPLKIFIFQFSVAILNKFQMDLYVSGAPLNYFSRSLIDEADLTHLLHRSSAENSVYWSDAFYFTSKVAPMMTTVFGLFLNCSMIIEIWRKGESVQKIIVFEVSPIEFHNCFQQIFPALDKI